jgi:hypothetical protein
MGRRYSLLACFLISIIIVSYRFAPVRYHKDAPLVVTTWDALGYYLYLPSIFIYHDFTKLEWFPEIDKKYSVSGGNVYQFTHCKNGNYVFKYLGGVAIMEFPFFISGHLIAGFSGYQQDGFSPPYQFAIAFGAILYFILAIFILRKILLRFFNDTVSTLTLLLMVLATNLIQYISIDGAMSHGYIFPLYVMVLYFTIRWHEKPSILWASLIGLVIGLASISRPTEAVMLFIPLLWGTQSRESSGKKWEMVRQNKMHLLFLAFFGFLDVIPQLIYWKLASGSFIYDVGSKWEFLSPHFRVLFGFENGWFIYTPITIFFIAGMFFIKKYPFRYSVITFCLLNIYIIIAWHDWRYGATYSCRALTQSYPVFALPFAAFIDRINTRKWRYIFYAFGLYSIILNLFQIWQYNKTILHYRDMNRKYYCSIYLNPDPTPLDMSLLDTDEMLGDENKYAKKVLYLSDSILNIVIPENSDKVLFKAEIRQDPLKVNSTNSWLKIESRIKMNSPGIWGCFLNSELQSGDSLKINKIRLDNALSPQGQANDYAFYVKVPPRFANSNFKLFLSTSKEFIGEVQNLSVQYLNRNPE